MDLIERKKKIEATIENVKRSIEYHQSEREKAVAYMNGLLGQSVLVEEMLELEKDKTEETPVET